MGKKVSKLTVENTESPSVLVWMESLSGWICIADLGWPVLSVASVHLSVSVAAISVLVTLGPVAVATCRLSGPEWAPDRLYQAHTFLLMACLA